MRGTPTRGWDVLRITLLPARWVERARGRRRALLVGIYLLIGALLGSLVYRQARLVGLPDVGDPFDPTPLRSLTLADDANAFVLYRRARSLTHHDRNIELRLLNSPYAWPAADDAEALAYIERNAEALRLWKEGTGRPDALERPIADLTVESKLPDIQEHRHFIRLACLHVSKSRDEGDVEAAWDWLRAILRSSRLVGRNGVWIARLVGVAEYQVGVNMARTWMADPRASAPLLRRALADVVAINALTPPASDALKIEYVSLMKTLEDPDRVRAFFLDDPWSDGPYDRTAWYNHWPAYHRARWFLANEPEVSRRVSRLAFANWLAHCDDPVGGRPAFVGPPDLVVPPREGPRATPWFFDGAPSSGPAPRALAARVEATPLAQALMPTHWVFQKALDRERGLRGGLVVSLAQEVFRRERGRDPESPADLVGTILERFPDGYTPPD